MSINVCICNIKRDWSLTCRHAVRTATTRDAHRDCKMRTGLVRVSDCTLTQTSHHYISRESKTTRNVLWSRVSVCLSVCVCVRGRMPTLLHGPGCNLGRGRGCPLVVHYFIPTYSFCSYPPFMALNGL